MPYPNGTYVNQIEDFAVRHELEQFYSLLQGYLSAQHKDDGSHGAITADSVTASGAISGASVDAEGDVLGQHTSANRYAGIQTLYTNLAGFRTRNVAGPFVADWAIVGDSAPNPNPGGLGFVDLTSGGTPMVWRLEYDSAVGIPGISYRIIPPGTIELKLGDNDAGPGNLLSGVYASTMESATGYKERFRTTPIGEWTAYSASIVVTSGGGTIITPAVSLTSYMLLGKTLFLRWRIQNFGIATASVTEIAIPLPGGFTTTAGSTIDNNPCMIFVSSLWETGFAYTAASDTSVRIQRNGANVFTVAPNGYYMYGQIALEVQ